MPSASNSSQNSPGTQGEALSSSGTVLSNSNAGKQSDGGGKMSVSMVAKPTLDKIDSKSVSKSNQAMSTSVKEVSKEKVHDKELASKSILKKNILHNTLTAPVLALRSSISSIPNNSNISEPHFHLGVEKGLFFLFCNGSLYMNL
jgi:hypothetical protein